MPGERRYQTTYPDLKVPVFLATNRRNVKTSQFGLSNCLIL